MTRRGPSKLSLHFAFTNLYFLSLCSDKMSTNSVKAAPDFLRSPVCWNLVHNACEEGAQSKLSWYARNPRGNNSIVDELEPGR
jgi:hypothetical protein